jgi:predicted esterase
VVNTRLPEVGNVLLRAGRVMAGASKKTQKKFSDPFLIGYSNGGFFLSLVLAETKMKFSGAAVLNGGAVTGINFGLEQKQPVLLVAGKEDTFQLPRMTALNEQLKASQWTPEFKIRPGGHPQEVKDFDLIFEFAQRATQPEFD